ncbi:MAG: type I restriction enzyme HsdR N-terminal domain-containing protein [Bacteroidetes bacterium]|nr:type I restriction enzyme HsdR N-terminal domain-containing protein [Bacteroidota bacterium]
MKLDLQLTELTEKLRLKKEAGKTWIWDPIRRKPLVLTPEEMVRQLLVAHLIDRMGYNPNRITVERMIKVNGMAKRCDILCYDQNFLPWMLIECKAPSVKISEGTFRQIAMYNLPLRVPYLLVSNGPDSFCCAMDYEAEDWQFISSLPRFGEGIESHQKTGEEE